MRCYLRAFGICISLTPRTKIWYILLRKFRLGTYNMHIIATQKTKYDLFINPSVNREGRVSQAPAIHCFHGDLDVDAMEHCSAIGCAPACARCGHAAVTDLLSARCSHLPNQREHRSNRAIAMSSACPCQTHSGMGLRILPLLYAHSAFLTFVACS